MIQLFDDHPNYQTIVFLTYLLFGTMNAEVIWNEWSYDIRIHIFGVLAFKHTYSDHSDISAS